MDSWARRLGLTTTLAAGAGGLGGVAFLASRGRLHLDVGWGRSVCPLGPIVVSIDAARDVVFESVSAPYLATMPSSMRDKLVILERHGNLVVAEHRTHLPLMDAITVESVLFEPPGRVSFRLLRGPVPYVVEEFVLEEDGAGTRFTYRGELGADLWLLGRIYGAKVVKPAWEAVVTKSLAQVKSGAEQRSAARRRREGRKPG